VTKHADIECDCRHWAEQMHRAASAVEADSDGSPAAMQVIDGNRAVANTLEAAANEIVAHRALITDICRAVGCTVDDLPAAIAGPIEAGRRAIQERDAERMRAEIAEAEHKSSEDLLAQERAAHRTKVQAMAWDYAQQVRANDALKVALSNTEADALRVVCRAEKAEAELAAVTAQRDELLAAAKDVAAQNDPFAQGGLAAEYRLRKAIADAEKPAGGAP
jgi:hypothetical protein